MTKAVARDPIYRRRRFQSGTIELCVRWYLTYRLSYRDLVEMMAERGVTVSHSTILRWVQRYVPEFERRWGRYARRVHSSWRMDETAVSVRGGAHYLYRAVDKYGKTVDSLLCVDRSESAARAFFNKALKTHQPRRPTKVISTAMRQVTERCDCYDKKIPSGGPRRFSSLRRLWARALGCHDAETERPKATVETLNRHCTRTQVLVC
jgi:transposase-like protein